MTLDFHAAEYTVHTAFLATAFHRWTGVPICHLS